MSVPDAAQQKLDLVGVARRDAGAPPAARYRELSDGEVISGEVVRLPMWAAVGGTRLFLRTATETVAIPATGKRGQTVLERELAEKRVRVGDHITIVYLGKRQTLNGKRIYRLYTVSVGR
jgi:hypothetical protein